MKIAMFAPVVPNDGGFGMWQRGGVEACWPPESRSGDAQADLDAFLEVSRDNGFEVEPTAELDGRIFEQNGAQCYRAAIDGREEGFFLLWIEERE